MYAGYPDWWRSTGVRPMRWIIISIEQGHWSENMHVPVERRHSVAWQSACQGDKWSWWQWQSMRVMASECRQGNIHNHRLTVLPPLHGTADFMKVWSIPREIQNGFLYWLVAFVCSYDVGKTKKLSLFVYNFFLLWSQAVNDENESEKALLVCSSCVLT